MTALVEMVTTKLALPHTWLCQATPHGPRYPEAAKHGASGDQALVIKQPPTLAKINHIDEFRSGISVHRSVPKVKYLESRLADEMMSSGVCFQNTSFIIIYLEKALGFQPNGEFI